MVNNMMRNDLPYAPPVNGRWYKIFLENNNGKIKKTSSDIEVDIVSYEKNFRVLVNDKYIITNYILSPVLEKANEDCVITSVYNRGRAGINFSNINLIDNLTLYLYCVRL